MKLSLPAVCPDAGAPGFSSVALPALAEEKLVTSPAFVTYLPPHRAVALRGTGLRGAQRTTSLLKKILVLTKTAQVGKDAGHTEAHEVRTYGRTHRSLL